MDPIWGYQAINVEAQQSDASSLLHWTRNMIALRKLFQVFGRGTQEFLHPENRKVLAYIREYTRRRRPQQLRDRPLRRQPLALRAARRARPQQVRRPPARRDARLRPFPHHNELTLAPYAAHARALQLLLARAPARYPTAILVESESIGVGASGSPRIPAVLDPNASDRPAIRVGSAEQSNTSILYNQTAILKLFRRVRPGENPEVEIGRI
jgi:hypothetical protein